MQLVNLTCKIKCNTRNNYETIHEKIINTFAQAGLKTNVILIQVTYKLQHAFKIIAHGIVALKMKTIGHLTYRKYA